MNIETFAVIAFFILGFGLVSGYLEKTVITPPIAFVTTIQSESHRFQTDGRGLQASEPSSDDSPS
jgi:hypothetical protein